MKKPKRITTWIVNKKTFTTFKAFKRYAWYNMRVGEITEGLEIFEDTIFKRYLLKRTERRLLIEKTYDMWDEHVKELKKLQLNLFDNENHR